LWRGASWPGFGLSVAVVLAGLLIVPIVSAIIGPGPGAAHAQSLDVLIDSSLGSGVTAGTGDGETSTRRTPMFLEVEVGFVIDRDFEIEWGLGTLVQLENQPALALRPQLRLVRPLGWFSFFADVGLPVYTTPFTRYGGEVGAGLLYKVHERFSAVGSTHVAVFFAGSDLPEDSTVVMFNVGLGGRVHF
jgi:hypothetical protein